LSGLLLTLAGAQPDTVSLDYLLSRIGTEPAREQLLAFAMKESRIRSLDEPGFLNLASLREVCWRAFLDALEGKYGGFHGYVTKTLGFPGDDVETIVRNLRARA
jgi:protein tyrosine/serine phosphatase